MMASLVQASSGLPPHLGWRRPHNCASVFSRIDHHHGLMREGPRRCRTSTSQIATNCVDGVLADNGVDRSPHQVDPTTSERLRVHRHAAKFRWAEVAFDSTPRRERAVGMRREEAPDVEVLDARCAVHVVERCSLAERDTEQAVSIQAAKLRFTAEEVPSILASDLGESLKILIGDPLKRPLPVIGHP